MPPLVARHLRWEIAVIAVATIALATSGCRSFHARHAPLRSLTFPCDDARTRLNFLDPCQGGKVPVVLIHGVFDNSKRWGDLIHDLRACPVVCDHCQIWTFDYDSDQEFFCLSASLRQRLDAAITTCDPTGNDPAVRQAVLIGHSLG